MDRAHTDYRTLSLDSLRRHLVAIDRRLVSLLPLTSISRHFLLWRTCAEPVPMLDGMSMDLYKGQEQS